MEALCAFLVDFGLTLGDAPVTTADASVVSSRPFCERLKDWQTLIGAGLALVVAVATILTMWSTTNKQLKAQKNEAKKQRERRRLACRAVMPADLSTIVQYAEGCAELALKIREIVNTRAERQELECPLLPERVIANLQMLIEQLEEENANAVAELLSCYQVQRARLNGLIETYNHPDRFGTWRLLTIDNVDFTFEQTLELHLRATTAFDFARRKTDQIPVPRYAQETVENSLAALHLANVLPDEYIVLLLRIYSRADQTQE